MRLPHLKRVFALLILLATPSTIPHVNATFAQSENTLDKFVYIYYNDDVTSTNNKSRRLRFSFSKYVDQLTEATQHSLQIMLGPDCQTNNNTNGQYNNDCMQASVQNLQFCVVLNNIQWNPAYINCSSYDETRFTNTEQFIQGEASYMAYALFDIAIAENQTITSVESTFSSQNSTNLFLTNLNKIINQRRRNTTKFKAVYASFQDTYETVSTKKKRRDSFAEGAIYLTYALYVFISCCILLATCAWIHSKIFPSDNAKLHRIILFGIWTWDFFSDVMFAIRAFEQKFYGHGIASAIFVVVPWTSSMLQLVRSEAKWMNDNAIKHVVATWLFKRSKQLIFLTAICGSAWAAIELCNSRAFGGQFFDMGLTERHLKKFHATRIYSTIILENIPQMAIQIAYFLTRDRSDIVAVLAFLSSFASVFITCIDVYSALVLVQAIKSSEKASEISAQSFVFEIVGDTILQHVEAFRRRPNAIRHLLSETIEVDERTIEFNMCAKTSQGLLFGFVIYTPHTTSLYQKLSNSRFNRLMNLCESVLDPKNCSFVAGVIRVWDVDKLTTSPDIGLNNIATFYSCQNESEMTEYQNDIDNLVVTDLYLNNYQIFNFEQISIYQSICINTTLASLKTPSSGVAQRMFKDETPKPPQIKTTTTEASVFDTIVNSREKQTDADLRMHSHNYTQSLMLGATLMDGNQEQLDLRLPREKTFGGFLDNMHSPSINIFKLNVRSKSAAPETRRPSQKQDRKSSAEPSETPTFMSLSTPKGSKQPQQRRVVRFATTEVVTDTPQLGAVKEEDAACVSDNEVVQKSKLDKMRVPTHSMSMSGIPGLKELRLNTVENGGDDFDDDDDDDAVELGDVDIDIDDGIEVRFSDPDNDQAENSVQIRR